MTTVDFDPARPITGTDGLDYRLFNFPIPLPEGTAKVLIKRGASSLAQEKMRFFRSIMLK